MKNKQEILALMNSEHPVLLHFYTTDCTKQKDVKSKLRCLAKEKANVKTVNVEIKKQPGLVDELEIDGLPMVLCYWNGKEQWRRAGDITNEQLWNTIALFENRALA